MQAWPYLAPELLVVNDEVRELISHRTSEHASCASWQWMIQPPTKRKPPRRRPQNSSAPRVGAGTHQEVAEQPTATAGFAGDAHEMQLESAVAFPPSRSEARKPGETQGKERVLVVEDSPTIASEVKYFLEL